MEFTLKDERLEMMKKVLFLEQEELHYALKNQLEHCYDYVYEKEEIGLYAPGDIPVILLAHLDTVHVNKPTEETLFYDTAKNQMICINNGIGADCRAGVFNILELLKKGYRPHVLFSWNEEIGCVGTGFFTEEIQREDATGILLKEYMSKINFAVQFDRRGFNEAVYYSLDNQEFENYISSFGYHTEWGSFTDIAELCPVTGFAGVNVSAGYTSEHTRNEILHVSEMLNTQRKVENILLDQMKNPKFFEYKEYELKGSSSSYDWSDYGYKSLRDDDADAWYDNTTYSKKDSIEDIKADSKDSCYICDMPLIDGSNWEDKTSNIAKIQALTCFDCRDRYYQEEAMLPQWWIDNKIHLGVEVNHKEATY